ncbi:MAG: GHKL domain-containing protein [Lachnospiraceae bacterium]|nr:GHKL domain-containing protein [Lachnospiraceae bacterium]MDE7029873.1 GHKL domain-containing protein [Lachnospiraceae bacterium]
MAELGRKFLYRIFCVFALIITLYLLVDLYLSQTLNIKVMVLFGIVFSVIILGFFDWSQNCAALRRQEQELKLYKLYIKPLEELTKDIRARQHEFDNHMNAILNMHVTIDNYDELVRAQSAYCKEIYGDKSRCNPALLRISDKILAGFLYSKIISAPGYIDIDIQVLSQEIVTPVSEHALVEIIGTLTDNAFEAATPQRNRVEMVLDAQNDKLSFAIKNQVEDLTMSEIAHFFEKGYTTKKNREGRGLGLYQANQIARRHKGEITVELTEQEGGQEICFGVTI